MNETVPLGDGSVPCRRKRGPIDLINALIYLARDRYRRLQLLHPGVAAFALFPLVAWPRRVGTVILSRAVTLGPAQAP